MELINEHTREFNKNIFFENLEKHGKPINLKCVEVSEVGTSKINNKPTIYLNMEILTEFPIIKTLDNGKQVKINPFNQIISLPYGLKETRINNIYQVSNRSNLYILLNHALKLTGSIPENNTKGFYISIQEITEALEGVVFNVVCQLEKETNYKPYYKLIIASDL